MWSRKKAGTRPGGDHDRGAATRRRGGDKVATCFEFFLTTWAVLVIGRPRLKAGGRNFLPPPHAIASLFIYLYSLDGCFCCLVNKNLKIRLTLSRWPYSSRSSCPPFPLSKKQKPFFFPKYHYHHPSHRRRNANSVPRPRLFLRSNPSLSLGPLLSLPPLPRARRPRPSAASTRRRGGVLRV